MFADELNKFSTILMLEDKFYEENLRRKFKKKKIQKLTLLYKIQGLRSIVMSAV